MNTKLKEFFDIDIIDVCIRESFAKDFDILLEITGGEAIRFFVYPETKNFRLTWYGSSLEAYDSTKVLYLQSVTKIATVLNNKDNLKKLVDILGSK